MTPPSLYAQVQLLTLAENMDTIHGTDKHIYEFQNTQGKGRTPALCSYLNQKAQRL